jgi:hypothetical protein
VRHFRDAAGIEWQVFLTERSPEASRRDHHLPEAFRAGWLVFESSAEKRRLGPVPAEWESLTDAELAAYCARAIPQTPKRGARAVDRTESALPLERTEAEARESLQPELQRAEERLNRSLEQACETPAVEKLDTGELIRVEETLALAADAAKEAVSLRRKLRVNREEAER